MRRQGAARMAIALLACACLLEGSPQAAADVALREFAGNIGRYAALRARYEAPLPPFDGRRDPWSLQLSRLFLASAVRTARAHATLGDIFTPQPAAWFRATIADAIYSTDIEGLRDEEGEWSREVLIDLTINEPVPPWARREVPGALLHRLPPLPPAIEYRLVDSALILWDVHAEILIDALPDALVIP